MIELLRAGIKVKALAYLLALAFLFSITITAARADKDTYLVSGSPNQNFGADTTMDIKGDDNRRVLIEFNLSTIPSTSRIQTAVLQLYVTAKGTGTPTVDLYRINNTWIEGTGTGTVTNNGATWNTNNGTANWNTAGGDYHTTVHANATLAAINTWYSWNITNLVQTWVNGTYPNYGMLLRDVTTNTGTWTFASGNNSNTSLMPILNITYTLPAAPSINSIPLAGTVYNQGSPVNISINATDNDGLSTVYINLTYPNASIQQIVLANTSPDIFYTTFTATNQTGIYTIRIIANDTFGNSNRTETTTFAIQDITPPTVQNIIPTIGMNYTQNTQVSISTTAIDTYVNRISAVYANITRPDGMIAQANLTNTGGDTYTANFTDTSIIGIYYVQIIANDASNNINNTEQTQFNTINNTPTNTSNSTPTDTTPPTVTPAGCSPTNAEINQPVVCNATIIDNIGIDYVYATITLPDSTTQTNTTTNTSSNYTFIFQSTAINGTYTVIWTANDTSNNINNTETTNFIVLTNTTITNNTNNTNTTNTTTPDTTPPTVLNITPLAGTNFSLNSIVDITVNITDDTAVDTVFANITNPDLTLTWIQLFDADNDDIYNNSVVANQAGWYYITIIANDTSGNINNTEQTQFDPATLGGGGGGGGGSTSANSYSSPGRPNRITPAPAAPPAPVTTSQYTETSKKTDETPQKQTSEESHHSLVQLAPRERPATIISGAVAASPAEPDTIGYEAGIIAIIVFMAIISYLSLKKSKTVNNRKRKRTGILYLLKKTYIKPARKMRQSNKNRD